MGYIDPDRPDVFISYAHLDDEPVGEPEEPGWVTALYRRIGKQLRKRLGSGACDVWMDHRFTTGDELTEDLDRRVRESALLLIVLSPSYVNSRWCGRELDRFLSQRGGREPGELSRVLVVEFDRVKRPERLQDVLGKLFWREDFDNPAVTCTLGYPKLIHDDQDGKRYNQRLNSLVCDLADRLTQIRELGAIPPPGPPVGGGASPSRATIFLAKATNDLADEHLEVRDYLVQQGFAVVPEGDYPRDEPGCLAQVRADLARSVLAVQLLSGLPGRKLEGSVRYLVALQRDCALERGLPILGWRSPGLDLDEVGHSDQAALLNAPHVLKLGLEEFKAIVLKRLEQLLVPPPPEAPPPLPNGLNKLVFINTDRIDLDRAKDFAEKLRRVGAWVSLPFEATEATNPREYLAEKLGECDVFLLFHGETKSQWVNSQMLWSRKPLSANPSAQIALVSVEPRPKQPPLSVLPPRLKQFDGEPSEAELDSYLRSL